MNRFIYGFVTFVLLFGFSSPAVSKELIKVFKGSESRTTAEFEVKAPWIVDWMTTGDYPGTGAIDVHLISSPGGQYLGKVVSTRWVYNGVKLFDESGVYRFKVDSNLMNWSLRIEQLTRQEAEEYTPKALKLD